MKWKIAILILIVFATVSAAVYLQNGQTGSAEVASSLNYNQLIISPQAAKTSVIIRRASLKNSGYIVVRGGDGKRVGQVIEISQYLEAGEHEDITIEFGDFYTYDETDQLIVMIYRDDGDKSFNELDEPVNTSAVFAKTGKPVLASVFEHEVAPSDGMGMVTVRYTNTGFQPAKLTVPAGTMVEFINQSDMDMWVASNMHPSHEILATFDQFQGVEKGQSYMYTFDKKGVWPYHDHINPAIEGVITVE